MSTKSKPPSSSFSRDEQYMLFRLAEEDGISELDELVRLIQAEYNKRQYKELQNHDRS